MLQKIFDLSQYLLYDVNQLKQKRVALSHKRQRNPYNKGERKMKNIIIGVGLIALCSNVALAEEEKYFCDLELTGTNYVLREYNNTFSLDALPESLPTGVTTRVKLGKVVMYNNKTHKMESREISKLNNCTVTYEDRPGQLSFGTKNCTVDEVSVAVNPHSMSYRLDSSSWRKFVSTLSNVNCGYTEEPTRKVTFKEIWEIWQRTPTKIVIMLRGAAQKEAFDPYRGDGTSDEEMTQETTWRWMVTLSAEDITMMDMDGGARSIQKLIMRDQAKLQSIAESVKAEAQKLKE